MISDFDVNFIYFSDLLPARFPNEFEGLISICEGLEIEYGLLPNTKDIWCRDYMPVQVSENKFVCFKYEPDYLLNKDWRHTIIDPKVIFENIGINPIISELKIDGGNIVKHDNKVILTDRIYKENPDWSKEAIIEELHNLLESEIIIIPQEPGELTGHADGIVRFLSKECVFVNNYSKENKQYHDKLITTLRNSGLDTITLPYEPSELKNKYGDYTALGLYINFLQIGDNFLLPSFGDTESEFSMKDFNALETMMAYKCINSFNSSPTSSMDDVPFGIGYMQGCDNISHINCRDLAMEGGLLNCITWTIKK